MLQSLERRLKRLENAPQSQCPQFTIEYTDGHHEHWRGADIISHCCQCGDEIKRVMYDAAHGPSADIGVLLSMICDHIEVFAMEG